MPRISLIVPNLNEGPRLELFLESLTRQTMKDFEVVIVDGGSTDNSFFIIRDYAFKLNLQYMIDHTRNIGFIRNLGAEHARAKILFHTSSDTYFPPNILTDIVKIYSSNSELICLSGRTFPLKSGVLSVFAYQAFDLIRYLFTCAPYPIRRFRPSGNFTTIKTDVFWDVFGFPRVRINEDALLGKRVDLYAGAFNKNVMFCLSLYVGHYAKRFKVKGGVSTLLFYLYVVGNMLPFLKPLFRHIEEKSARVFASRSDLNG